REQVQRRLTLGGFTETGEETLHGRTGSDFTLLLAADSVRQRKQPATLAGLIRRLRKQVAEIVFIVLADSSAIGKLREFHFQHRVHFRRGTPDSATHTALGKVRRSASSWQETGRFCTARLSEVRFNPSKATRMALWTTAPG